MIKLTNEQENQWIIRQLNKGVPVREVAAVIRVTPRRIYQLKRRYEEAGEILELKASRKKTQRNRRKDKQVILQAYNKYKLSPVPLEKLIKEITESTYSSQHIHKALLKHNLVEENRKKRRKWVRI